MTEASKGNWWNPKESNSEEVVRELESVDCESACIKYRTKLAVEQNLANPFPTSTAPANRLLKTSDSEVELQSAYTEIMPEYRHEEGFSPSKCDMQKGGVGHKIHLNVSPENIKTISEYLIRKGYCHKFLNGGEILNGKIFTVYIGSHDLTNALAQTLSMDLQDYLSRPIAKEEVEYAPNIIGRFTGGRDEFQQYGFGIRGITIHNKWADQMTWNTEGEKGKILPLAFTDSYNALSNRYGSYFYGTE